MFNACVLLLTTDYLKTDPEPLDRVNNQEISTARHPARSPIKKLCFRTFAEGFAFF